MAAPVPQVDERLDPWTEEDYLALPVDRRVELLDGALLVSPLARSGHQRMLSQLWTVLSTAARKGLEVLLPVNLRVAPGRILIPDIVVVDQPGLDVVVYDAAVVVMVVEISGTGRPAFARAIKPELYARAGISHYLRIELRDGDPVGFVYRLAQDRYVEVARSAPGRPLVLTDPIAVTLDLAALAAATHPPR